MEKRKWLFAVQWQPISDLGKVIKSLFWVMPVMSPSVRDTWLFNTCKPGRDVCQQSPVTHFQAAQWAWNSLKLLLNCAILMGRLIKVSEQMWRTVTISPCILEIWRQPERCFKGTWWHIEFGLWPLATEDVLISHVWISWLLPCCYSISFRERALFHFRFH